MNQYVNHFQCSRNNDTGETIIHFFQVSPNLVMKNDRMEAEGVQTDLVASVVMTEQNAKAFIEVLSGIMK